MVAVGVGLATTACSKEADLQDQSSQSRDAGDIAASPDTIPNREALEAYQHFSEDVSVAACGKAFECCSDSELDSMNVRGDDAESCANSSVLGREFGFGLYDEPIRNGGVQFDEDLAELCLQSIENLSCEEFSGGIEIFGSRDYRGCAELFQATRTNGETCTYHVDCESGFCQEAEGEGENECSEPPQAGEPCSTLQCASGTYCDQSGASNVCRPKKPDGEPCLDDQQCESDHCSSDESCAAPPSQCDGN